MEKVIINSYEEFEKLVGQQIGVSEWLEIPQERINQFADATLITSGFMWMQSVPKRKVLTRVQLYTGILPCLCYLICGIRLSR